jgi:hypothetical protein
MRYITLSVLCFGGLFGCQHMGIPLAKESSSVSSGHSLTTQNEKTNLISSCQMKLEVTRVKSVELGSYDTAKTFELYVDANNCIPPDESFTYQYYVEGASYRPWIHGPVQLNSVKKINDIINRLDLCSVPIRGMNIQYAIYAEAILNKSKAVIGSNKVALELLPDEFSECI